MSVDRTGRREDLDRRIEAIESGYEFMLAYAAQGRDSDRGPGSGSRLREFLQGMAGALDGLRSAVEPLVAEQGEAARTDGLPFLDALERDAATALSAVRLVLGREDISSQLVDNLNASIHLRAVLTDLFVIDALLEKGPAAEA